MLIIGFFLLATIILAINFYYISYDDAYITFRYARNLATGEGLVYNPGENFLGTTTPLLAILLALLSLILPTEIPALGGWVSCLALGGGAIFLYLIGREIGQRVTGFVAGILLLTNPLLIISLGGEATLLLVLVLAANLFYFRKNFVITGILVGLAFLTRGEGVLMGIPLLIHYIFRQKRLPFNMAAGFLFIMLPWFIFSLYTFGSPLPSTLSAKIAQGESGLWPLFLRGTKEWIKGFTVGSDVYVGLPADWRYLLLLPMLVIGTVSLIWYRPVQWWTILVWSALQIIGYSLLFSVPFYHWYIAPLLLSLVVISGFGTQTMFNLLLGTLWSKRHKILSWTILLTISLGLFTPVLFATLNFLKNHHYSYPNPAEAIYRKTGEWLAANTPPKSSVGYFEIGFLGYYSRRPIVDPVGLVNPGVTERIAQRDFLWALQHYKPDYIIYNPLIFQEWIGIVVEKPWFSQAYQEIKQIEHNAYPGSPLIIFELKHKERIPEPSD